MIICNDCDNKLNLFNQFRINSVRVQHEFADIIKSFHPIHYETNIEYYPHEMESIRGIEENMYVNVENIYASTPAPTTIHSNHGYENQCYIDHDLELTLGDDQTDNQSLVSMSNNDSIYTTVQQPHISPLSPAVTPILVPQPQITPQVSDTPIYSEGSYVEPPIEQYDEAKVEYSEPKVMEQYIEQPEQYAESAVEQYEEQMTENNFLESFPEDDNNSFTYDDFDDTCQSVPSDRNNVDNAIDKKIEEFIQNKGKKANPKICTVCNKLFRTNYKLRVHMETHAENNAKFICTFENCNKAFKSKIGLKEHAARHTGTYNFTCETCQKQFLLKSYFVAHQRIHSTTRLKSFACSLCPKVFKSKQNLIDHENCHLGLKYFKCEVCSKSFVTKTHLDHHVKSHNQSDQFLCSICNKFLKTKNYLKIHIKTHFEELKNYTCGYCKKKFIQMSDLKIHSRTHTKEKNFVCET